MRMKVLVMVFLALLSVTPVQADTVSFDYKDADLVYVLLKLAEVAEKDIFVSPEVKGGVTLAVQEKPAMATMDQVLEMQNNKYGYKILGDTIVVVPRERLDRIKAQP